MKDIVIELLPIQDAGTLFHVLFQKLKENPAFSDAKWLVNEPYGEKDCDVICTTHSIKESINEYFYSKSDIITYEDLNEELHLKLSALKKNSILVPIHSFTTLHCVIALTPKDTSKSDILQQELGLIVYYIIVLLDRLIYTNKLKESNISLIELNKKVERINLSLSKQLQVEIEKSQKTLSMAQQLQEDSDINKMKKEIAHEINNPLSIFKLNLDLLAEKYMTQKIEPFILAQLEQHYKLPEHFTAKWLFKMNLIDAHLNHQKINYADFSKFEALKEYPKLYRYVYSVFISIATDDYITSSLTQFEKLNSTIHNIIKYGIKLSHAKNPVNMMQLIDDVCDLSKQLFISEGITLKKEFSETPVIIIGKKTGLYQALINIVKNSVEAMKESSTKELTISCQKSDDSKCQIIISDTGSITDKSTAADSKSLNLGIGLKIVSSIIKEHQGTVDFKSNDNNGGFTVTITVPIYASN